MPDEMQTTIITGKGEMYTAETLARKLKGAIVELGQEVTTDEDSAVAALAGFDASEGFSHTMDADALDSFVDEFCNEWEKE